MQVFQKIEGFFILQKQQGVIFVLLLITLTEHYNELFF